MQGKNQRATTPRSNPHHSNGCNAEALLRAANHALCGASDELKRAKLAIKKIKGENRNEKVQ
jgi:hypothetical protein